MRKQLQQIQQLVRQCVILLEKEGRTCQELAGASQALIHDLQGASRDPRLNRLASLIKEQKEHAGLLPDLISRHFLESIEQEVNVLLAGTPGGRFGQLVSAFLNAPPAGPAGSGEILLAGLLQHTGAQRGFILFWQPDSSEAGILTAINYRTTDLGAEEYQLSRTLLASVLEGRRLLLEDAVSHPAYTGAKSVQDLLIRSVAAVPLRQGERTAGVLYLEDNRRPAAFDEEDLELLELAGRFLMFWLQQARLLPVLIPPPARTRLNPESAATGLVGEDPGMCELAALIRRLADSPATILIQGENGTGKELAARALHSQSARAGRPFIAINCAALPENLVESELFGHEKGAFTGAATRYRGRVEQAAGGTLFLDEVGELALHLQAKLLRFLQSGEFQRLGGEETLRAEMRILAATSRDLPKMMQEGRFLEAFYHRLNVIPLRLPALRERRGDIPLLIGHFLGKFNKIYHRAVRLDPAVIDCLTVYPFPGNVRELENLIHRLVAISPDEEAGLADLPGEILRLAPYSLPLARPAGASLRPPGSMVELRQERSRLQRWLADQERRLAEEAVRQAGGRINETARTLGMHRVTLYKLLRRKAPPAGTEPPDCAGN